MKLLGLLQLAVAIYAIVMIIQSSAETGAKVLWVLLAVSYTHQTLPTILLV